MSSSPPRPPSTSSSDVQAEVRRQLLEMMAIRDEESRRLRAQVKALSMENRSLRLQAEATVQSEMRPPRQGQVPKLGLPGLGWIGRGLGTLIGQPKPSPGLDLATIPYPEGQARLPTAVDFSANEVQPSPPGRTLGTAELRPLPVTNAGLRPRTPSDVILTQVSNTGKAGAGLSAALQPHHPPPPGGLRQGEPEPEVQRDPSGLGVGLGQVWTNERGCPAETGTAQPSPPPVYEGDVPNEGVGPEDLGNPRLDPLDVVLTGMAQLQSVVTELTSPKANGKPEVIKPGVTSLPDLPNHGPESSLAFADWLHASKPALADVSDTSEELWRRTVEEATSWYNQYLHMDPLSRLTAKPEASPELSQPKWARVSRRIETMIIAASPKEIREEVSASRTSGLLPLVSRLFVIYGPGTLMERELGLRHIAEPPVGATISETIEILRRWKRWCARMTELGGVLPDPSIQVRALTKATKTVLTQNPEVAFRVNLVRASLQIDVTPDSTKVAKLHAQILAELEAIAHRGDKAKIGDKEQGPQVPAKVKGVEAQAQTPAGPKNPKTPKSPPKPPPAPKPSTPADTAAVAKPPCTFFVGNSGCKKGQDCAYEHCWANFSAAEKALRCRNCGSKSHRAAECKAGIKGEDKAKGRPVRQPKAVSESNQGGTQGQGQGNHEVGNQQIKSTLADAARFLQQAIPETPQAEQVSPTPIAAPPQPTASKAAPAVQGTPVTLASLSAQLESLRAMAGNPEIRTCMVEGQVATRTMNDLLEEQSKLRAVVQGYEARICAQAPANDPVALLDSGATHAVVAFEPGMTGLEKVPVTLAGDAKQEWLRTREGTLVVPPEAKPEATKAPVQTILPLGALVECLGCSIEWSKRGGLRVKHPTLGVLRTGVSGNTCPYVQEQQALQLIAELEAAKLGEFQHQLHTFECQLEARRVPIDPSKAWERFADTGTRRDALAALFAQPYLDEVPEELKASLAEAIPTGKDLEDGKSVLKDLPLRRSSRRLLLNSDRWVVHLCSGKPRSPEPLKEWSDQNGMLMLHVDVLEKGGKGWDLLRQQGVWRALLWAASKGKIAAVLSSPPRYKPGEAAKLPLQAMVLWSFASVMRKGGIPYLAEQPGLPTSVQSTFGKWSGTEVLSLSQGALGDEFSRPTVIQTNLDLKYVSTLPAKGRTEAPPHGREWTLHFRKEIVRALKGCPSTPSCNELDKAIAEARGVTITNGDQEEQPRIEKVGEAGLQEWREHILNGHVPYRKDCRRCVEGAGLGIQRRKVKYPHSYALSADLFGPVPPDERGRDETCVSGNTYLRYALVGAFRVPRSAVSRDEQPKEPEVQVSQKKLPEGLEDLDLAEYEPSEAPQENPPHLEEEDDELRQLFELPDPGEDISGVAPFSVEAVDGLSGNAVRAEPEVEVRSSAGEGDLIKDPEGLKGLVEELKDPVEQVVLRFVVPLKGKSGPDVTEGLQKMILAINAKFPVRILHTDPGTEFMSASLSKWLANHGVRVQHSLPTDKKGNGLAERTVGWVKSRIRTLIGSSGLPVHFWPLAARWAAEAHNRCVLNGPRLPAFGQQVLHRVKQPADGTRQLMHRWVVARYVGPHSSIPDGHVLVTGEGNLVASRGFRSDTVDPEDLPAIDLPILQELEEDAQVQEEAVETQGVGPSRRLRSKTAVKFIECSEHDDPETFAGECLVNGTYTRKALKEVLSRLPKEAQTHKDRRGLTDDRFVFGAYCHGGLRGLTTNTRKFPLTTKFLNECMRVTLEAQGKGAPPTWTALLITRATNVSIHKDFRNEWGSLNHVFAIPGAIELWRAPPDGARPNTLEQPDWRSGLVDDLNEAAISFNARYPHAVRKNPDWILVAYTPLGSVKLKREDWSRLKDHGFRTPPRRDLEEVQVKVVSQSLSSHEPHGQEPDEEQDSDGSEFPPPVQGPLEADCQEDSYTPTIGWDVSRGPGDYPRRDLQNGDLFMYLRERFAEHELERLLQNGVEEPADLPFLYEEDLLEMGIPSQVVKRIMFGIHPPGTIRPDSPAILGQRTGEVRMYDRSHRQIPWVIQNRTLAHRSPGPPVEGLGVKTAEDDEAVEPGDWDRVSIPEETGADPTDSPKPQVYEERASSSTEPVRRPHAADRMIEDQLHMMYMQAMWDDDDANVDHWPPAASSSSTHQVFVDSQTPDEGLSSSSVGCIPEETSADPTDSPKPQVHINYECRTVRAEGPSHVTFESDAGGGIVQECGPHLTRQG